MAKVRSLHRLIGLVLLVPLVGWALTGAFFFIKPGYAGAYEMLAIKTYALDGATVVQSDGAWLEVRLLKTILGEHLLVRTADGWQHLEPRTKALRAPASEDELRLLVGDAFSANPARYGQIVAVNGNTVTTDTGIRVTVNWERLTLTQRGADTERIDWLYKIHYLQWTGIPALDKIAGAAGIALLLLLSLLGVILFFRR